MLLIVAASFNTMTEIDITHTLDNILISYCFEYVSEVCDWKMLFVVKVTVAISRVSRLCSDN